MTERRRGLGRGLGALIPSGPIDGAQRPVDVFFPESSVAIATVAAAVGSPEHVTDGQRDGLADNAPGAVHHGAFGDENVADENFADGALDGSATEASVGNQSIDPDLTATPTNPLAPEDDTGLLPVPGARFADLPVNSIGPNARQPRQVFAEEELEELAGSIREVGVLQPIVVRPSDDPDSEVAYELIMGERRWRAAQSAGLQSIPAIIRFTSNGDMLRDALLENLHRVQLNPLEEAAAYQQLLEDFGCTHEQLASRVARSRPQISNTIRLLRLPPAVQRRVAAGVLSAGHARAVLGLTDHEAMDRLAQRIVAEGLSVRATEEIVALGDEPARRAPRRRTEVSGDRSHLVEIESRLSDRFDTRVRVAVGQRKGRITVEFATLEDLDRLVGLLAPGAPWSVPADT